ncbi:GNAT family N-acetyltransferase [Kitasatospora purpeofusca]|uniref:GNAT family N-acetyltransferase n=1 Tax=Kitasatospora purpeofusca TaxID=67352 RepID=UPI002A5B0BD3|nr:GNAT family N-acetyltransferase [Kitasatospora purpeofusca]MDY0812630.1 GNAT family N-acetyltransferase [Kitasatospora purpeofusca]
MIELRELAHGDAGAVECIYGPESVRFLGRGPMGAREAQAYVAGALAAAERRPRTLHTLGLTVDDDLLGVVKLHLDRRGAAVSYILRADVWGRGYATEGVLRIVALGTGKLGLTEFHATHHADNVASGRVLMRAGFVPTGVRAGLVTYALSSGRRSVALAGTGPHGSSARVVQNNPS